MAQTIETASGITFTRISNDINGNPRYVCHYSNIPLTPVERVRAENKIIINKSLGIPTAGILEQYSVAIAAAKRIGGRKFHNKQYGGGIVFQSYNINETAKQVAQLATV